MSIVLIYINMFDMDDSGDQPLGYLLYHAMAMLRPHVAAELRPLALGLPEFLVVPAEQTRGFRAWRSR
jgi:hypothetical protein